ncbi:DUF6391 domain-containing protein [Tepidanaerobacter syntrophicus]|uniref:Uncharacterized protein n=1 Tax=Tepidanaerobacter syntrophicus TaxID=224999 RepID=A0A0U9HGA0_9FIRM|nr:DUF6391 domain-containing protein [Tepidanaerobacter syntrophicus]GAQ25829.1 hypothetical protein TSYNT_977 [Tepidanaerobacter syntrophicus]
MLISLLIFLMLAILFPYLLLPMLIFLGIGFLFLLPYVIVFNSFYNIITIPWQIIKIATDRRVRKNHSLEHATINVLEQRYGRPLQAGGLAYSNGFSLSGPDLPPIYEVMSAVKEAQFRMINGETDLAIHPRCGTSIAAANFLFSLAFIIVLFYGHHLSLINVILAFLLANILAKPFGRVLQKYFTTYPKVDDVAIQDIYVQSPYGNSPFTIIFTPTRSYFIKTYQAK